MWQMLFATVADGIANCVCIMITLMADVIACVSVVDVKPLTDALFWQMLLPSGRWKSHCRVVVLWQMLLPVVDGKPQGQLLQF